MAAARDFTRDGQSGAEHEERSTCHPTRIAIGQRIGIRNRNAVGAERTRYKGSGEAVRRNVGDVSLRTAEREAVVIRKRAARPSTHGVPMLWTTPSPRPPSSRTRETGLN